jgi:hypothetical protein
MKIFNHLFRPYVVIRELQKENTQLKAENIELKDTNESLWDMLYHNVLNTRVTGEA